MSTPYRRDLERLRYWQGQGLRSADARDQGRFDALRRQLHNRALHSTGGVAFGLGLRMTVEASPRVEVACGLAYDSRGRELALQRARALPLPAQAGWLVLRVRNAARRDATCCTPGDTGCTPAGTQLLESDLELAWTPPSAFEAPGGVVLGRFDGTQLDADFVPEAVRPLAKPRLARGETVVGNTPWEPWTIEQPDGQGGIVSQVVGVQTHVDTSASGFTATPHYVANLQAKAWDPAKAEFAPAFFPQVADPAPDGFTFRLLMTDIARRRYGAWFGTARVASAKRELGDRLTIETDGATTFKKGDVVAQLRPRARRVMRIDAVDKARLVLAEPLADVTEGSTLLAVAVPPRFATVTSVPPDDPVMLANYTATPAVRKGDVLQRVSDDALAAIDSAAHGVLTVGKPFAAWKATDALMVARLAAAADVKSSTVSPDGAALTLELKPATHGIEVGMSIVLLAADKQPLAGTARVVARAGASVDIQPVPSAANVASLSRVAPLAGGLAVQALNPKSRAVVGVDTVEPFTVGDFVAVAGRPAEIAIVEKVDEGASQLELSPTQSSTKLAVEAGVLLVASDWQSATTVAAFSPATPQQVTVGRPDAARVGDMVALRALDDFASPVSVAQVAGTSLALGTPLTGAQRLDSLAVGRFARVATVVSQDAQQEQVMIAEAGALVAGDCVMLLASDGAADVSSGVVQVVATTGAKVVLAESLGTIAPGARLGTVTWRDCVGLKSVDGGDPTHVEVDRDIGLRAGQVVGVLSYYADCSNPGLVDQVQGNELTLLPSLEHGDGIVEQDWIDGGIVGPAAVTRQASQLFEFPSTWQPIVRMETLDGLDDRVPATAYGLDLLSGAFQSRDVLPVLLQDAAGAHLVLVDTDTNPSHRFRPETLSLVTRFNNDFPRAFAAFAQAKELALVVRWFGCQRESQAEPACPGQRPFDPCVADSSTED